MKEYLHIKTDFLQTVAHLNNWKKSPFQVQVSGKEIVLMDKEILIAKCSPPLLLKKDLDAVVSQEISTQIPNILIVLAQAGSASLGFSEAGILKHHKVIKKYMVRKSQGKAQLTHLKTKGKSRLGSRIRLQQTDQFFNEIHEKIEEWNVLPKVDLILYSCPVRLWSFLFDEADKVSFEKNDPRLIKIPLDLEVPGHDTLKYVNKYAYSGIFYIKSEFADLKLFEGLI